MWNGRLMAVATILAAVGCAGRVQALPPPAAAPPSQALPDAARDRVHVFLIHGLDPLDWGNMRGLCEQVNCLGFRRTHYGQCFDAPAFQEEILRLHCAEPDARFVVIGFSFGARKAWDLSRTLCAEGVPLDLLVCLDGKGLGMVSGDGPGACRFVNVIAPGCLLKAPMLMGAENLELSGVWHYGAPTHPQTLGMLACELTALAAAPPRKTTP
jgi:hypothetical protein